MSDVWSLKGLKGEDWAGELYDAEDIAVLREKLIEDIKKLEYQYSHSLSETNGIEGYLQGFDEAKDYIRWIINNRFGVK